MARMILPKKSTELYRQTQEDVSQYCEPKNVDNMRLETLSLGLDGKSDFYERLLIFTTDHRIMMYWDENDPQLRGVLDVSNARLQETNIFDGQVKLYGFTLMARMRKISFFAYSEDMRDKWISVLSGSCILLDIRQKYTIST